MDEEHYGEKEYRKQLFFLLSQTEGISPVQPELWRHVVNDVTEALITGCPSWPSCNTGEAGESEPAPTWWRDAVEEEECGVPASPVNLEALGGPGTEPCRVRRRLTCSVCACIDWETTETLLRNAHKELVPFLENRVKG